MYLSIIWPKASMADRTENSSLCVSTKLLPCVTTRVVPYQRVHKIYLKMCWLNPSHTSRDIKKHLNIFWPNPSHASENTTSRASKTQNVSTSVAQTHSMTAKKKCISTCVHKTHPIPVRKQHVSEQVLTKFSPCQRGKKSISTCVD